MKVERETRARVGRVLERLERIGVGCLPKSAFAHRDRGRLGMRLTGGKVVAFAMRTLEAHIDRAERELSRRRRR